MSEANAGSDVVSMKLRAEKKGYYILKMTCHSFTLIISEYCNIDLYRRLLHLEWQ